MHHDTLFEVHRQRVARLGAERNPRYLLPHKPLAFLALVYAGGREVGKGHALPSFVKAYRYLADMAQQWPPRPLDALRGLHRGGFLTLHGEDGRELPRRGPLPLTQKPCRVALPPDLAEMLADPSTRERLLAAGYFQFCEEQKEGMAGLWDELKGLLARRDELEDLADPDTRPMMPQRPVWLSLTPPTEFRSLLDLEGQVLEQIQHGRPALLGQIPYDEGAYERLRLLLQSRMRQATYYPASLSLFLVWTGMMHYGNNTFWPEVHKRTGLSDAGQTEWGRCFEAFLQKHGLHGFHEDVKAHRYVTPILGHGGIPKSCLPELFSKLIIPAAESGDSVSGHQLRSETVRGDLLAGLQVPVQRFLRRGGRVADDFLDRCLTMAREVLYEGGEPSAPEVLGLPPHVVHTFHEWLEGAGQRQRRRQRYRRPSLLVRPGTSLHLVLPTQRLELEHGGSVTWVIESGGHSVVRPCRVSRRGEALETEADEIAWPQAMESSVVSLHRGQERLISWELPPLVGADESWAFIDPANGRRWQGDCLPRGEMWFLRCEAALVGSGVEVIEESPPLIARGRNWQFTQYDFTDVRGTIRVDTQSGSTVWECEPLRPVLRGGDRLDNVETEDGAPVYLTFPHLQLPATEEDFTRWVAVIRPIGRSHPSEAGSRSLQDVVQVQGATVRAYIEDLMPADAVGQWELALRGPLGRIYTFRLARIPELEIGWATDSVNASSKEGIIVVDGRQNGEGGVEVGTQRYLTATYMATIEGEVDVEISLRMWVPRWRWRLSGVDGIPEEWCRTRLPVCDDILLNAADPRLEIEMPPAMPRECRLQLSSPDGVQQEEILRAGRDGVLSYSLRPFFETLRERDSASHLMEGVTEGVEPHAMLLVFTEWAPQGFRHEVGAGKLRLHWRGGDRIPSRVVRLVSLWSAKQETWRFPVPDGEAQTHIDLETSGIRPGQFRVDFLIEDDWSGETVRPGSAFLDLCKEDWVKMLQQASTPAQQVERLVAVARVPSLAGDVGSVPSLVLALARTVPADELKKCLEALAAQHMADQMAAEMLKEAAQASRMIRYCSFEDCTFVALASAPDALSAHARAHHAEQILDDLIPLLGYDEYKRRFGSNLPAQIYRCNKCTNPPFYLTANQFPASKVQSHINSVRSHAGYAQFSLIRNLEEIRRYVLPHVELTRVCKICAEDFINRSEPELLNHVIRLHGDRLFVGLDSVQEH